jgi:ribosomal-protein-alanine N-acetyltransferase
MIPPHDDIDRIMDVMEQAFPPEFGEAWNRRQVSDLLLLSGTRYGLIAPSGATEPEPHDETAGFFLSRSVLDEEELLLFAISPAFRRRGLGHALLSCFIDQAKGRGMNRIFLEMRAENPAGHLYAAHGFVPTGIRPLYYRTPSGKRLDAISQELRLD